MAEKDMSEIVKKAFPLGAVVKPAGKNTHAMTVTGHDQGKVRGSYKDAKGETHVVWVHAHELRTIIPGAPAF